MHPPSLTSFGTTSRALWERVNGVTIARPIAVVASLPMAGLQAQSVNPCGVMLWLNYFVLMLTRTMNTLIRSFI